VLTHGETVVIADSKAGPAADTVLTHDQQELRLHIRHVGKANVLFLAGNVATMTEDEALVEWPRFWDRE
jgi:hypothetical protein